MSVTGLWQQRLASDGSVWLSGAKCSSKRNSIKSLLQNYN